MRKHWLFALAMMATGSVLAAPAASASEGRGQPFITAEFYKDNISLEQFRVNPRSYFKSEAAFDLIVDYVGDEIGRPLSSAEFVALMRDDSQTRMRDCAVGENINTGAMDGNQFYWFIRGCRAGEQIVQVRVNGHWVDLFSLNCLNAVEDQQVVSPPPLTSAPPITKRCRWVPVSQTSRPTTTYYTPSFTTSSGCCEGCTTYMTMPSQPIDMGSSNSTTYQRVCD